MADLTERNKRKVELNERVSETEYDVLYPVTKADYVDTTDDRQFVSQEQIDKWNNIANSSNLIWKGQWTTATTYAINDVVECNGKYYISKVASNSNHMPTDAAESDEYWTNLNLEAYTATRADKVKVESTTDSADRGILLQGTGTEGYKTVLNGTGITYNPGTGEFKVGDNITLNGTSGVIKGNIEGLVDGKVNEAGHADSADYAETANYYAEKVEDGVVTKSEQTIAEKFAAVEKTIEQVSGGAAQKVANSLKISVDGTEKVVFDGSSEKTIDIKQTYDVTDIQNLLDGNDKILEELLPDSILGQLSYMGTWDPATGYVGDTEAVAGTITKGDYYIATGEGNKFPDGKSQTEGAEAFETGDWAVYNGTTWDKIDNTDAVRTVNGQIGNVQTYKGDWAGQTNYYKGDIVKNDGKLYICNANHKSGTDFSDTNWDLFGRTYTGDAIITVEGDKITHKTQEGGGTNTDVTLAKNVAFIVPSITTDGYGHVEKIDTKTITLGADFIDTVRKVQVNGNQVLDGTAQGAKPINFVNGTLTTVSYGNDAIRVDHNAIADPNALEDLTIDDNTTLVAGSKFHIPNITVDAYGHITAGELKEFTMTASPVTHEHFNIVDNGGIQNIRAYNTTEATAEWIANAANKGKIYWGDADTLRVNSKWGATELYQGTNKVLDGSIGFDTGYTWQPVTTNKGTTVEKKKLESKYNATTNAIEMADTGVAEGVYSVVRVNAKGLVCAGGQIVEFGSEVNAGPSDNLAVGGLFFRKLA